MYDKETSHYHPKEHTILYVFRAPGYDLPCIIKLIQTVFINYNKTNLSL